jgi:hypothetical protein
MIRVVVVVIDAPSARARAHPRRRRLDDASSIFFPSQIAHHVRTSCTVEREAIDVARAKSTHAFRSAAP